MKFKGKKVDGITVENYSNPITGESSREVSGETGYHSRTKRKKISNKRFDENWDRIFNK